MSPYLHNYWWRNKPPTTIQEAKPKKEGVPSEAEASPPPQSLTATIYELVCPALSPMSRALPCDDHIVTLNNKNWKKPLKKN